MHETKAESNAGDWDFKGCNTQYGTHGIHTYVAAMIPQLARRLVDKYTPRGEPVFDPFCGGGSVLVEAVNSGRPAIGRDVNPLAILVSIAKTTPVSEASALQMLDSILAGYDPVSPPPLISDNLAFWFKPEHWGPLYSLRNSILNNVSSVDPLRHFFEAVFSATVRDVSLTYRNEVRLRRMSAEEIAKFNVDPIERFKERGTRAVAAAMHLPDDVHIDIKIGDAQQIDLAENECASIVCSPPYGDERNGVSYTQFSKNMLSWLDYTSDQLKESKNLTLGWGNAERTLPTSDTLEAAVDAISEFPASVKVAVAFYADYQAALQEMARVTRGPMIIVIGKRVLRDTVFDNGVITTELMKNVGIPLSESFFRQLPSKRLPRMRRFGAAINKESILVFRQ